MSECVNKCLPAVLFCTDNAFASRSFYAGKIVKAIMNAYGHP